MMCEKTYAMKILDILSSDNDRKQKYTQLGRVVVEEISGAHTQGRKEALEEVKEKIEKVNWAEVPDNVKDMPSVLAWAMGYETMKREFKEKVKDMQIELGHTKVADHGCWSIVNREINKLLGEVR